MILTLHMIGSIIYAAFELQFIDAIDFNNEMRRNLPPVLAVYKNRFNCHTLLAK